MTINRVYCGINSDGQVCVDSTNSSTVGGGFWPKGTADQYVFNSGLQVAGVIGTDGGPWANDTTGGFFFDATGQLPQRRSGPADLQRHQLGRRWRPGRRAACVPQAATDSAAASVFDLLLQVDSTTGPTGGASGVPYCRRSASQGDIWFMSWEGNPALTAGRTHPLGDRGRAPRHGLELPVRQRRHPVLHLHLLQRHLDQRGRLRRRSGRPMRDILLEQASGFQTENAATFGSTLPDGRVHHQQHVRGLRGGHGRRRGRRPTTPR